MKELIEDNKFVELKYQIIDRKSNKVLTEVEYPLGYVHGVNDILAPPVMAQLAGKAVGDTIEVPIDCTELYGERDESLVFTDRLENVPEEFREVGMTITMENENGDAKNFIVTRMDDKTLTVDGNNPLCGREVIFKLDVITVREASDEEIAAGGKVDDGPDLGDQEAIPV